MTIARRVQGQQCVGGASTLRSVPPLGAPAATSVPAPGILRAMRGFQSQEGICSVARAALHSAGSLVAAAVLLVRDAVLHWRTVGGSACYRTLQRQWRGRRVGGGVGKRRGGPQPGPA